MPAGKPWPKISIVTPSYNQGQFIEETIRSVLLQGYPNLEFIIIDAASTDNSVDIIKKYEKWLAYWVSELDKGQSGAINKGLRKTTGEIVAYLNSDDLYAPNVFSQGASFFRIYPNAGIIYGKGEEFDDRNGSNNIKGEPYDLVQEITSFATVIFQPSTFIGRRAIDKVGFFDENLHFAMDYDMWTRIALEFPVVFVPKVWSKFRVHSNSKTGKQTSAKWDFERHITIKKIYSMSNLPQSVKKVRKTAFAFAYYLKTSSHYSLRESRKAFFSAVMALKFDLRILSRNPKLFMSALLGTKLTQIIFYLLKVTLSEEKRVMIKNRLGFGK